MTYDFAGFTVIVTGGTRGIGRAISEAFLSSRARVVATYAGNDQAAAELRAKWPEAALETIKFNLSSSQETEEFCKYFEEKYSRLEVLVNNAGIRRDNVVGMMPRADWEEVIAVNLTAAYHLSKFAVLNMMRQRFGRIINITSPSGKLGFAGQANYASAKAGQVALTKSLAREVAKRQITVNCVSPGFIETDFISGLEEGLRNEYRAQVPLKRFGTAVEVAHAVLFLATRESSYITGSVLEVTGGL